MSFIPLLPGVENMVPPGASFVLEQMTNTPRQDFPDLGSGLNYRKKGLNQLFELIQRKRIRRLVLTHEVRLPRFGWELIFAFYEIQNIEIVIINEGDPRIFGRSCRRT